MTDEAPEELVSDGIHWQSFAVGTGEIWVLGFMRVERIPVVGSTGRRRGWSYRAWDVLRVPVVRPMHKTTFHKTLDLAKAHCEAIMKEHREETVR
jgi:hypothetical protein